MRKPILKGKITFRCKPELREALRQGAAYHGIRYQTYLHWLLEEGVKSEAHYYGWVLPSAKYRIKGATDLQQREIRILMKLARRKVNIKNDANEDKNTPSTKDS